MGLLLMLRSGQRHESAWLPLRQRLYNAGFTSNPWHATRLLGHVNGRTAKRDRLEDGSIGDNTGGTVTYPSAGLRWSGPLGLTLEGALQAPVAQALYGEQTEHTTGRFMHSVNR